MRFIVLRKGSLLAIVITIILITLGSLWSLYSKNSYPTVSLSEKGSDKETIHLITTEYKSKTADGKEIESYRWDPGTIIVNKGKEIELRLYGVNGMEHPFYIEGTSVKGVVTKGKETIVHVTFSKEGVYRLICTTHETIDHNGPMIAYIVVD